MQDQEVTFNMFKSMQFSNDFFDEQYFKMDLVDGCVMYNLAKILDTNPIEKALIE